jgi:hypothetical protein
MPSSRHNTTLPVPSFAFCTCSIIRTRTEQCTFRTCLETTAVEGEKVACAAEHPIKKADGFEECKWQRARDDDALGKDALTHCLRCKFGADETMRILVKGKSREMTDTNDKQAL